MTKVFYVTKSPGRVILPLGIPPLLREWPPGQVPIPAWVVPTAKKSEA